MGDFELYSKDGEQCIKHLTYPRWEGRVAFGPTSDIEDVQLLDNCLDALTLARSMREAADYLLEHSRK